MTHDSFAVSEEVVQVFEQENGVKVTFLASGDTGAALNKAILTRDAPLADVFYGVDNTFLSRASRPKYLKTTNHLRCQWFHLLSNLTPPIT